MGETFDLLMLYFNATHLDSVCAAVTQLAFVVVSPGVDVSWGTVTFKENISKGC